MFYMFDRHPHIDHQKKCPHCSEGKVYTLESRKKCPGNIFFSMPVPHVWLLHISVLNFMFVGHISSCNAL